ncbi:hypothetical protein [Blastococcus sp. LR1]|uniref:hypothetical protein n=1 Tax=Blastococcus sp. LR1 TaxID=2877000 RepID=UPI001CCCB755|nr:hypothetical protein [Blastococcus sp. LR1]MCA0146666.1 hypothetical protein [Blastococcus sp. LR1]
MASEQSGSVMVLPPQIERNFEGRRAVYLDLKDWINLARVAKGLSTPAGYPELLLAARRAVLRGTALFPLSATHYMEMSGIADPAQRRDVASVMEELSGFRVLLGRPSIMRLEIEAALDRIQGLSSPVDTLALLGRSVGWAYGRRGGLRMGYDGRDVTSEFEQQPWYQEMLRAFERRMLEGLSDAEDASLRLTNSDYQPEFVQQFSEQRARQEREQAARLDAAPRWRRGRLRDVISARELALEWAEALNEAVAQRGMSLDDLFGTDREAIRAFADGMPSNSVVISIKTAYHRNDQHNWTANDIHDIDALAVAVPYCDAVLTDKAARNAVVSTKVDRQAATFMPRTAGELAEWLDSGASLASPGSLA